MYVSTNTLPEFVRSALKSVEYHKADVEISYCDSLTLSSSSGSDGRRGFTCIVNMNTGQYETKWGSWGGANMFNLDNPVDLDNTIYPMVPGMLVIKGTVGYPLTWCIIYAHKDSAIKPLQPVTELSEKQMMCLFAFKGFKSFYRPEWLSGKGIGINGETVKSLIALGYLKENKAGAKQITTEGKNILGDKRYN